tara:strand:+ start:476 stop:1312 length:837 start_codon:yes stop_codon:yes gene_type:complete
MPSDQTLLSQNDFDIIRSILHEKSGITIADHKKQMVENRITKRMKELNLSCFSDYTKMIESKDKTDEMVHLVNSLTTNVTHFFREGHHFTHLAEEMSKRLNDKQKPIRLWSAACSIGAEPYSCAMTILDTYKKQAPHPNLKILATDIDTIALKRARNGQYPEKVTKGLSKAQLLEYFTQEKSQNNHEKTYRVKQHVRKMVSFNYLNFNQTHWPMSGPFDFIFCRNALIYFNREKQNEYIEKMLKLLAPGGFFYLGHSEHSVMEKRNLKIIGQTIYQKP